MSKMKITLIILAVILIITTAFGVKFYFAMQKMSSNEDPTYWEKDITEIEKRYEEIPDVDIVFIGSSSIRKWVTLEEDFSEYTVVNHGFGGSKVADSTYFYDRLITPFNPEVIVIFAGTNDINGTEWSKTGLEVFELFKLFYEKSQLENPDVYVYYISISPTKARWSVWEDANEANDLIKAYALTQDKLVFIDTTDDLLKNGVPNKDILSFDGLHLNEEGYDIWATIIKPIVTEVLNNN